LVGAADVTAVPKARLRRRCAASRASGDARRHSAFSYVEHTEGDGDEMFKAVCKLGLEGIISKKLDDPKATAATRAVDGTF